MYIIKLCFGELPNVNKKYKKTLSADPSDHHSKKTVPS